MGRKRKQWLKISNRLLSGTMVLLGFSACNGDHPVEYGQPHADYELKGRVTNQVGAELVGMRVITKTLIQSRPDDSYLRDTVMTDTKGTFILNKKEETSEGRYRVICEDPSGVYEADSTELKMEPKGGKGWYEGHDSKQVNFQLKKKNA